MMSISGDKTPRHEELAQGNSGWVRYRSDLLAAPVFVRFEDQGGRLVPVDLFVTGLDGAIDTTVLRSVPLGRIEAWANTPEIAPGVMARLPLPGPDLRRAASYFSTTFGGMARSTWVTRMFAAQVKGSGEKQVEMIDFDPGFAYADIAGCDPSLPIPAGRRYGDAFYRIVAERYAALAREARNPVTMLATVNNVPLSTVQRWVREARRRGFLPPARAGKRG